MSGLYGALRPLLFALNAETAHDLAHRALKLGLVAGPGADNGRDNRLITEVAGVRFPNPVGLAAGFDKDAQLMRPLQKLGFGSVEVGTITPQPQPGNKKPRLFRLKNAEGVINRFGFNSLGADAAENQLARRPHGVIGVNIGANKASDDKIADYCSGLTRFSSYADYVTVNISSPNTPGLRALQDKSALSDLLSALKSAREALPGHEQKPIFLKIAPDLSDEDIADIVGAARRFGVEALIVSNTTISRPVGLGPLAKETGGLSGKPVFDLSTRILRDIFRATGGAVPLVGVGGIMSGSDAYLKILNGASLVQLYSGLVFKGPGLVQTVVQDLSALLAIDGHNSVEDAVGADL